MKNSLAPRSKVTTLNRVEAVWSSLEEHFALNASIERVFRDFRGRFKSGRACIITAELVTGLHPPDIKTKVATTLDMKRCWREQPGLVYSRARSSGSLGDY